jgi:YbbR domain-containing protein
MGARLLRNVGLKFLSICIAVLLWLVVAGDRVVERALRVPVEFQNLPTGLEIVGDPPETVDVRLRGPSVALGQLGPGDTSAVLDLRNARPGRRLFHLTTGHVNVPYGIEVVQVTPATLPIGFESAAVRVVRVRASIEGRPAAGHEVGTVTVEPATVEIIGPESALRGLDEAMTEPVPVTNAMRPVREVVTIGVADPTVRLRAPQTASVTVQIVQGSASRTLSNVPVIVRNLNAGLRGLLTPSAVSITVRSTQETVGALTSQTLAPFVDASGLGVGDHIVEAHTQATPGVMTDSIEPPRLRLRIVKLPQPPKGAS